jgi:hypothetical protein
MEKLSIDHRKMSRNQGTRKGSKEPANPNQREILTFIYPINTFDIKEMSSEISDMKEMNLTPKDHSFHKSEI